MAKTQDFHSCDMGSIPMQITVRWCNGNISDCRSDVMGSTPVRTAGMRPGVTVPWHFHEVKDSSLNLKGDHIDCRVVYRSSISVFETDGVGSNPAPASLVVVSLTGKASHCA